MGGGSTSSSTVAAGENAAAAAAKEPVAAASSKENAAPSTMSSSSKPSTTDETNSTTSIGVVTSTCSNDKEMSSSSTDETPRRNDDSSSVSQGVDKAAVVDENNEESQQSSSKSANSNTESEKEVAAMIEEKETTSNSSTVVCTSTLGGNDALIQAAAANNKEEESKMNDAAAIDGGNTFDNATGDNQNTPDGGDDIKDSKIITQQPFAAPMQQDLVSSSIKQQSDYVMVNDSMTSNVSATTLADAVCQPTTGGSNENVASSSTTALESSMVLAISSTTGCVVEPDSNSTSNGAKDGASFKNCDDKPYTYVGGNDDNVAGKQAMDVEEEVVPATTTTQQATTPSTQENASSSDGGDKTKLVVVSDSAAAAAAAAVKHAVSGVADVVAQESSAPNETNQKMASSTTPPPVPMEGLKATSSTTIDSAVVETNSSKSTPGREVLKDASTTVDKTDDAVPADGAGTAPMDVEGEVVSTTSQPEATRNQEKDGNNSGGETTTKLASIPAAKQPDSEAVDLSQPSTTCEPNENGAIKQPASMALVISSEEKKDHVVPNLSSATDGMKGASDCDDKVDVPDSGTESNDTESNNDAESDNGPTELSDIMDAISGLETPGSTCAGGRAASLPSIPGLHIEGVGDVPLPLSDRDAKLLKSVAEQAPHGQGLKTVVDTSVRNTLQIDPAKVSFQNPFWEPEINTLVHQATEALGVKPSLVKAELYKLLVYEPGGFFKKHRDTEKAGGMFATLVVQLPSKFEGGTFVVSHGKETNKFEMGTDTDEAAYGCHYVCHYADCEHEIQQVKSGHRLALIYSLCYTGAASKPSASAFECSSLSSLLQKLPPDDSVFVIPMEHQYTEASLGHMGASALKGADRAKQKALAVAGRGLWKTAIVQLERIDTESGDGYRYSSRYGYDDYYADDGDFEVYEVDRGSTEINNGFLEDGASAENEVTWMRQHVNFESVDEDGMLLVPIDDLDDDETILWGEGDQGGVEYTGNEGATRETTYKTYVLIAYSTEYAFERMCATDIGSAIAAVARDQKPHLLHRLLSYMKSKPGSISDKNGVELLKLFSMGPTTEKEVEERIRIILCSLSTQNIPSPELQDSLVALVSLEGMSAASAASLEPLISLLSKLNEIKNLSLLDFVKRSDLILKIQKRTRLSGHFEALLKESTAKYEAQAASSNSSDLPYHYSHYRASHVSISAASDALVSLVKGHGWKNTLPIVQVCVKKCRAQHSKTPDQFVQRITMLERLRALQTGGDFQIALSRDVVQDFLAWLCGHKTNKLSSSVSDPLLRHLFEVGTEGDYKKIETWAKSASFDALTAFETCITRVSSGATCRDAAAKNRCIACVTQHRKSLKLKEVNRTYAKLIQATSHGPPVFSWCMPNARHSNATVTAFLKSPRPGPVQILVGGGINNARSLARRRSSGYSARIEPTRATGSNASVRVTKTRDLFEAEVAKYRKNMEMLAKTVADIQMLGGQVLSNPSLGAASLPSMNHAAKASLPANHPTAAGASVHRPLVELNQAHANPKPAKKRRVNAPIPEDAEIVEID